MIFSEPGFTYGDRLEFALDEGHSRRCPHERNEYIWHLPINRTHSFAVPVSISSLAHEDERSLSAGLKSLTMVNQKDLDVES